MLIEYEANDYGYYQVGEKPPVLLSIVIVLIQTRCPVRDHEAVQAAS